MFSAVAPNLFQFNLNVGGVVVFVQWTAWPLNSASNESAAESSVIVSGVRIILSRGTA